MHKRSIALTFALLAATLTTGCHAQVPPAGTSSQTLPADVARRIAIMIRAKAQLPFNYDVHVTGRRPSNVNGYDQITVQLGEAGKPAKDMTFLISQDNKTLAQMNTFDISKDPRTEVSDAGRPSRGGSEKAPVTVVVFDDLECPFCARMHTAMFPAITARYGDKVHIVYKDFPLTTIHPWAIHAAVDADCLAQESPAAYWNFVDYMHGHLDEIGVDKTSGKEDKTLPVALKQVDKATLDEGAKHKINHEKLRACVERQDETTVRASMKEGDALNVNGVPALFINGEPVTGAVPIEFVYRAVDDALLAQGLTPPPAVPLPNLDAPASASPTSK